jgi:hypothetical protein
MSRGARIWLLVGVFLLGGVAFLAIRGTIEPASIWLDGEPDPTSSEVALLIFGHCDGNPVKVNSHSVEETADSVIVDLKIRVPFHLFGDAFDPSCAGEPYVLHLDAVVGDREILTLNPDGSTSPIQVNPY